MNPSNGFVGAGILGFALASAGCAVAAVPSSPHASAEWLATRVHACITMDTAQDVAAACDLVGIATPDANIAVGVNWHDHQGGFHCYCAASTELLRPATDARDPFTKPRRHIAGKPSKRKPSHHSIPLDRGHRCLPTSPFRRRKVYTLKLTLKKTLQSLQYPRRSCLLWLYAFALGALPAAAIAVITGKFGLLPIVVALVTWFGCLAIWFIAERLI